MHVDIVRRPHHRRSGTLLERPALPILPKLFGVVFDQIPKAGNEATSRRSLRKTAAPQFYALLQRLNAAVDGVFEADTHVGYFIVDHADVRIGLSDRFMRWRKPATVDQDHLPRAQAAQ